MNKQDQIQNTQRLRTDENYRKSFIKGLHEYQRINMPCEGKGDRRWGCGYDRMYESAGKVYHHFIRYCEQQEIDWETAHAIFREKYGEIYCDCDYLYDVSDE